jgi:hypothetical protein
MHSITWIRGWDNYCVNHGHSTYGPHVDVFREVRELLYHSVQWETVTTWIKYEILSE